MKRTIKVGIIQQTCTNDIRHNLSKLHHNIEQVAAKRCTAGCIAGVAQHPLLLSDRRYGYV